MANNNEQNKIQSQTMNMSNEKKRIILDYLYLIVGCFFYGFIGWRWNMAIATWIAPIFLMRFFRNQKKFWPTLLALLFLAPLTYLKMRDGWDIPILFRILVSILQILIPVVHLDLLPAASNK